MPKVPMIDGPSPQLAPFWSVRMLRLALEMESWSVCWYVNSVCSKSRWRETSPGEPALVTYKPIQFGHPAIGNHSPSDRILRRPEPHSLADMEGVPGCTSGSWGCTVITVKMHAGSLWVSHGSIASQCARRMPRKLQGDEMARGSHAMGSVGLCWTQTR